MEEFTLYFQMFQDRFRTIWESHVPSHGEWLLLSLVSTLVLLFYLSIRYFILKRKLKRVEAENRVLATRDVELNERSLQESGIQPSADEVVEDVVRKEEEGFKQEVEPETEEGMEPGAAAHVVEEEVGSEIATEVVEEEPEPVIEKLEEEPEENFFERLKGRLAKTHDQLIGRIDQVLFRKRAVDQDVMEELEEVLVTADLGVKTSYELLGDLQNEISKASLTPEQLKELLREKICSMLTIEYKAVDPERSSPFIVMVVGVNGVGKTTTVGKLAANLKGDSRKVMLVAADTFRPAAIEQLHVWSRRVGADFIKHKPGADPSAVVYDGMHAAISRGTDIVLVDTAGRLHTKKNLMDELKKIKRIMGRELEGAPHEILLVLDATTGQNAIHQARIFHEALDVTGIVLTKLDGTAKGGIIVGIAHELKLPVRFIGIGEQIEDLRAFNPELFLDALFLGQGKTLLH